MYVKIRLQIQTVLVEEELTHADGQYAPVVHVWIDIVAHDDDLLEIVIDLREHLRFLFHLGFVGDHVCRLDVVSPLNICRKNESASRSGRN